MIRYYSAQEACERLGISRNTLYSYVSRGLVRSEPVSSSAKTKRYHALDVDRLAIKSGVHKAPAQALQSATHWGAPILESAITLIGDECFYYRGRPVDQLADGGSLEEALALLWDIEQDSLPVTNGELRETVENSLRELKEKESPVDLFLTLLALLNRSDRAAFQFTPEATISAGVMMISSFQRVLTGRWPTEPVAQGLAHAWKLEAASVPLIDSALILVADHELNISSFTARCAASAGCSPYAAVAAATYAFFGRRHGGSTGRIRTLLGEAKNRGSLYEAIAARLEQGEPLPGFGHRLYDADPRSRFLLPRLPDRHGYVQQALAANNQLMCGYPTVDFALMLMELELALPDQAGTHLFYLGRLAGLVAHVMEQFSQNQPIRPRTRYVGIRPSSSFSE